MAFENKRNSMLQKVALVVACAIGICSLEASAKPKSKAKLKNPAPVSRSNTKGFYVGVHGGYGSTRSVEIKRPDNPSIGFSLASLADSPAYAGLVGYTFSDYFRTDLELHHRVRYSIKFNDIISNTRQYSGALSSTKLMLNGYLSLPTQYRAKPFITAGIGQSWNKFHTVTRAEILRGIYPANTTRCLTYQAGVGVTFKHNKLNFDGEIKYVNKGKARTKTFDREILETHLQEILFLVSIRYHL